MKQEGQADQAVGKIKQKVEEVIDKVKDAGGGHLVRYTGKDALRQGWPLPQRPRFPSKEDAMRTSRLAIFVVPLALAFAAAPALAHGPGDGGACSGTKEQIKKLCSGVTPGNCLSKLCPDVPPGPGQWAQCLLNLNAGKETQKLSAALTADCVTELTNKLTAIQKWQSEWQSGACVTGGDVSKNCGNVTGGTGIIIQCLRQALIDNKPVSKTCQTLLAQQHGHGHHPDGPGETGPSECEPSGH